MKVISSTEKELQTYTLFVTTLAAFITPFSASSVNIALPSIGRYFSLDAVLLSWISTSYLLSASIFLIPFGRMADIFGRKRIYIYGILIYTSASLLAGLSPSISVLITARVLQGFGGSMMFGNSTAILTSVFPPQDRGRVLGINVASVYVGLSAGPFIGGFLTQHLGWQSAYLVNVPLGLLLLILTLWKLKGEWHEAKGEKFDIFGSLVYGTTFISLIYGFTILTTSTGIILLVCGIFGTAIFLWRESTVQNPIFNLTLFRSNTLFLFSNLAALLNYLATFACGFLLSLYLQFVQGMNPQSTGVVLISQPLTMALFSPLAGRLSDKIEPRFVSSIGMALTTLALVLFIFLESNTPVIYIIIVSVILGGGFALFSSPNTNAVMSSVERKFYGIASGTLATMRLAGQMLSMAFAMMIFSIFMGKVQISIENQDTFLQSIRIIFIISSILCFFGIFASLARGKVRQ